MKLEYAICLLSLLILLCCYVFFARKNTECDKQIRFKLVLYYAGKGWPIYRNGEQLNEKELKEIDMEKYEILFYHNQKFVYLQDENIFNKVREYAMAGWSIYKNGFKINSDAFDSLDLGKYIIILNKEKKTINLKPGKLKELE